MGSGVQVPGFRFAFECSGFRVSTLKVEVASLRLRIARDAADGHRRARIATPPRTQHAAPTTSPRPPTILYGDIVGGITTFFTMAYIVVVNPGILASPGTGMTLSGVLTATVLLASTMTFLMGSMRGCPSPSRSAWDRTQVGATGNLGRCDTRCLSVRA